MAPRFTVTFDTCVLFDKKNRWQCNQASFTALLDLESAGEVRLILPDIIQHEAPNVIDKFLATIFDAQEVYHAVVGGDRHSQAEIRDRLIRSFEEICKRAEILSTANITAGRALDLYWRNNPPFGKGPKRKEFPDAFALLALQEWAAKNGAVHVVSEDRDWQRACGDQLKHFETLEKLLAHILNFADPEAFGVARALRTTMQKELRDRLDPMVTVPTVTRIRHMSTLLDPAAVFVEVILLSVDVKAVQVFAISPGEADTPRNVSAVVRAALKIRLNCSIPSPEYGTTPWAKDLLEITKIVIREVDIDVSADYDSVSQSCDLGEVFLREELEFDFDLVYKQKWLLIADPTESGSPPAET